ncbi:MAG: hypothetical protein AAB520_01515, partial [Patescibacteria group bacterium]
MAGSIALEARPVGLAAQEVGTPQIEYIPFSELTPERIAKLTDGEIQPLSDFSPDPLMRTIKTAVWFIHWNKEHPGVGRVSTI